MKRVCIDYIIDLGLLVSFLIVFITGLMKWPALLPNLGIPYSSISIMKTSTLHDWSGLIMGLLVAIHLTMHWRWIKAMTKNIFKRKK